MCPHTWSPLVIVKLHHNRYSRLLVYEDRVLYPLEKKTCSIFWGKVERPHEDHPYLERRVGQVFLNSGL